MEHPRPNFIYIGAAKAGSTWLHEVLLRHPEIFMSDAKELYFFDRYYDRGLDWYLSQFRCAHPEHKVIGEVCQQYLLSTEAARRIHDCLPRVRLMVTLREPAARAFSGYLYHVKHGGVRGSFREALDTHPGILDASSYASLLKSYLRHFDRSAIYVGLFDDLSRDPQGFIDPLLSWLGIAPMTLDGELRQERLPASKARSAAVVGRLHGAADFVRRRNGARLVGRIKRSPLVDRALYRAYGGGGDPKPQMSPEDARFVRELLEPDVVELEGLLGMSLRARWGFD